MKKKVLTILITLVFGGAGGFAAGLFIYPFLFPPAMEIVENRAERMIVATSSFIHANPSNSVYYRKGALEVLKGEPGGNLLLLKPDFKVGPSLRFHIYLADKGKIMKSADFKSAKKVDLGKLQSFEGSQIYEVPKGTDISLAMLKK